MKSHKGLLTVGTILAATLVSLYAIYSSMESDTSSRHEGLESLLQSGEQAVVRELEGTEREAVIGKMRGMPEWASGESFLRTKGFEIDPSHLQAYQAIVSGYVVNITRSRTKVSANMSIGELVLAADGSGKTSAWILVSNLPPETVSGMEPEAKSVPVTTWANGMPVFYVSLYHLVLGRWIPYHYWWHDSHDHPNWYYGCYDYWWWYYRWYGIEWIPWYDWFFSWYYNKRFYYWSTWFPIAEPLVFIILLLSTHLACTGLRTRQARPLGMSNPMRG